MAAKMYGGNKINSQTARKIQGGQKTDNGESNMDGGHTGLHKHMAQHGFTVGSSSGSAPSVKDGGWNNGMSGGSDSNASPLTNTNTHTGSGLKPVKPKNVYWSGDSVK